MRKMSLILIVALAAIAVIALWTGMDERLARLAVGWQRDYQNALARALRALRSGEAGASTTFLGICFAYGFLHAIGPGHGKALLSAYGMATDVPLGRMVGLAAITSLAQASVAVGLVYTGIWMFGGAREQVERASASFEPFSAAAIALLGIFLCWRGLRRLVTGRAARDHVHSEDCGCGHAHVPDASAVLAARSWREIAALVAGVALRPCTGALFLLILTWRLGLDGIGIAGAYVMGIGTMMVTGLAAIIAVGLRNGVYFALPALSRAPAIAGVMEIGFGGAVAILAISTGLRLR